MSSTAQKQEAVTSQQTKILVKNMMRISVSSICFHRDCFPPDCFSFRNYGNMKVIQLDAAELDANENLVIKNEKAFLLTQWLEKGVFKALEDGLLTALSFAIYTEHPITKEDLLLETYEFKFNFSVGNQASINGVVISSKDDIKSQAAKFVRNLISFTQTLDDLPKNNWITMQMRYKDEAPPDYEPEYFTATSESSLIFPDISCLRVKLGSIETSQMRTEAKFVGLESLLHEDLCQIKVPVRISTQHHTSDASFHVGVRPVDRVDALVDSMCGTSLLDLNTNTNSNTNSNNNSNVNANSVVTSSMNADAMELGGGFKGNNFNRNNNEDATMDYEPQLQSKAMPKPTGKSKGNVGEAFAISECAADDVERVKSHISQSDRASTTNIIQSCSLSKAKVDAIIKMLLSNSTISRKASTGYNSRFFVLNTSALDAFAQTAATATATTKAADMTPDNNAPAHAANPPKLTKRKVASLSEGIQAGESNIENENANLNRDSSSSSGQRSKRLASKEKEPASPPETQANNAEADNAEVIDEGSASSNLAMASTLAASSASNNNSRFKKVEPVKGKGRAVSTSAQSVADDIENSFESQSEPMTTSATYAKSQVQTQAMKTQAQRKQQPACIFPELSSIVKKSTGDAKDKENAAPNNISSNKINNNGQNSNNNIKKQQQQTVALSTSVPSTSGWHNTTNSTSDGHEHPCDDISSQFSQFSQQDSVQTSQDNGLAVKFGRITNPIEIVRNWAREK